jgi:AcrR family transcriptional regulator
MLSERHMPIRDAVRASVLAVGVRRTTLTDVAKRAGVSRMTLYRRYPDVDAVVRELMTHEFGAVLRSARDASRPGSHGRGRLVAMVVSGTSRLRENDLFRRVLAVDPELLLPYVIERFGGVQRIAAEALEEAIAAGQADGSIRDGDPRRLAHTVLLVVAPFVLSARTVREVLGDPELGEELGELLDRYLRP